jgi:type VI secretion system protein ImpB
MPGDINQDRRRFINAERVSPAIVLDIGNAQQKITIPFVLTVMSKLSGTAMSSQPGINERKLHQVLDKTAFTKLFDEFTPELEKFVKNRLPGGEGDLKLHLKFRSMKDFEVESIVRQVPALKAYFDERNALQRIKNAVGADPKKKDRLAKLELNSEVKRAVTGS